jgi:hypothetical protein
MIAELERAESLGRITVTFGGRKGGNITPTNLNGSGKEKKKEGNGDRETRDLFFLNKKQKKKNAFGLNRDRTGDL